MINWIKGNWLRALLICLVVGAVIFGICRIWVGVVSAVLIAIVLAKAFGQKDDKEEEEGTTPQLKDKKVR